MNRREFLIQLAGLSVVGSVFSQEIAVDPKQNPAELESFWDPSGRPFKKKEFEVDPGYVLVTYPHEGPISSLVVRLYTIGGKFLPQQSRFNGAELVKCYTPLRYVGRVLYRPVEALHRGLFKQPVEIGVRIENPDLLRDIDTNTLLSALEIGCAPHRANLPRSIKLVILDGCGAVKAEQCFEREDGSWERVAPERLEPGDEILQDADGTLRRYVPSRRNV